MSLGGWPGRGAELAVDRGRLMQLASAHDLMLYLKHRPGRFVVQGAELATIWSKGTVDATLAEQAREAFMLGTERTLTQDIEFGIDQLVEVAVRALFPGVNDPFTSMSCIDRLGEALCRLAGRVFPSSDRYDKHGRLPVLAHPFTFAGVTAAVFNQIRQYGRSSAAVTIRLLETMAVSLALGPEGIHASGH